MITRTERTVNWFTVGMMSSESLMQVFSAFTTEQGLRMVGKGPIESTGIAVACGLMYLMVSLFVTYFAPQATWRQFWAMVVAVLVLVPLYTGISTQFTVMDLGAREAEKVCMEGVIAGVDDAVRGIVASDAGEEQLVITLGSLGENWKKRSTLEATKGHDSETAGKGHVFRTEDNVAEAILTAVKAVSDSKAARGALTDSIRRRLGVLQGMIADRYNLDGENELRKNANAFSSELRALNEDLARLSAVRSVEFVRQVSVQLSAARGSAHRGDSAGQAEAMGDVATMVAATQKTIDALTTRLSASENVKVPIFTMVSPAEAVRKYKWDVAYAWAGGYAMDYMWFVFVVLRKAAEPLIKRLVGEEREEQNEVTNRQWFAEREGRRRGSGF